MAKLAVVACARLAGLIDQPPEMASPKNPVIEESLAAMITPYIVHKMGNILFIIFHDFSPKSTTLFFSIWPATVSGNFLPPHEIDNWNFQQINVWLRILWKSHKFWSHFDNFYFHYSIRGTKRKNPENQSISFCWFWQFFF